MASRKPLQVRLSGFPTPKRVVMDQSASPLTPVVRFYFDAAAPKADLAAVFRHLLGGVKEENGRYVHSLPATHPRHRMAYCEFVDLVQVGEEVEVTATYSYPLATIYNGYLIHSRNRELPRRETLASMPPDEE